MEWITIDIVTNISMIANTKQLKKIWNATIVVLVFSFSFLVTTSRSSQHTRQSQPLMNWFRYASTFHARGIAPAILGSRAPMARRSLVAVAVMEFQIPLSSNDLLQPSERLPVLRIRASPSQRDTLPAFPSLPSPSYCSSLSLLGFWHVVV